VVLGLITTKSPQLESRQALHDRVMEAAQYVPLDCLGLSPQCGFSGNIGNTVMTIAEQMEKLRLVVESARSIWQDA
jgi:5-methyltetrahydropteroyltriglutamate--homocysteine methyltransferase